MSTSNRRPYLTASAVTQSFLDACADNLSNQLELACDIETATGTLRVSDRHKYVGGIFYEALIKFPVIERTVGEWLSGQLEFSTLTIEVSNVDGRFDDLLPGGSNFGSWVGKSLLVRLGLRDVESTYRTVFSGKITDVGGFKRNTKSIVVIVRERFDTLNTTFPTSVISTAEFPFVENDKEGLAKPLIYGDWTTSLNSFGVPAFPVNGNDPSVYDEAGARNPVQALVSSNALQSIGTSALYLKRGEDVFPMSSSDVISVSPTNNFFTVQQGNITRINGEKWYFETGDTFIVPVRGEAIDGVDDNPLAQARHILKTFGGATAGEFATSWATYEASVSIKSRIWIQEPSSAIEYALSLLEQVRMEAFVDSDQKLGVLSLRFEDMVADPSYRVRNWDIELDSLSLSVDEKNNFNRAQGAYAFDPVTNENALLTRVFKNQAAITQTGKAISKRIISPNLYIGTDVESEVVNILKLASATPEFIDCSLTWRSILQDVGGWVKLNIAFGGVKFSEVPCLVRSLGYDPQGIKLPVRLWSFQQTPFPGWSGQGSGIVGGYNATIVAE